MHLRTCAAWRRPPPQKCCRYGASVLRTGAGEHIYALWGEGEPRHACRLFLAASMLVGLLLDRLHVPVAPPVAGTGSAGGRPLPPRLCGER
jgi:hypothetical protein